MSLPSSAAAAAAADDVLRPATPSSGGSGSSSGSRSRNSSCSSTQADADSDDDEDRRPFDEEPPIILTPAEHAAAEARALDWNERLFTSATATQRPSKLARALRALLTSRPPELLQLLHRCALKETPAALEPSHVPAGAPVRPPRPPRVLSAEDLALLRWEEQGLLWRLASRALESDFDAICGSCSTADANDIAHGDRTLSGVDGVALTYGEVTFPSLAAVLARHWRGLPRGRGKFIDIGSGSGKGIFAALLLHEFESLVGVEILKGLVQSSKELLAKYEQEYRPVLQQNDEQRRAIDRQLRTTASDAATLSTEAASAPAATPASASDDVDVNGDAPFPDPSITLYHADFRDLDWSDADVVFVNSTCFDEDLMNDLALYCERLKKGSLLITFTKRVRSKHFKLISTDLQEQSWYARQRELLGYCTVYAHRKIREAVFTPITKLVIDDVLELDKIMADLPDHLTSRAKMEAIEREQLTPNADETTFAAE